MIQKKEKMIRNARKEVARVYQNQRRRMEGQKESASVLLPEEGKDLLFYVDSNPMILI